MEKKDIRNFSLEGLEKEIHTMGEKPYRAKQVFHWLYKKGVSSFEEMTDIPETTRQTLDEFFNIPSPSVTEKFTSRDHTEKFVFKLRDNNFIETVLISERNRNTLCISTQVGCRHGCKFCASGKKFIRNLTAGEMINQVLFPLFYLKKKINNVVVMGMGEPFDNFDELVKFLKILNSAEGINTGARKITVSTCGLISGIEKFANINLQIRLSVSLHATNNRIRDMLMPINKKYPIEKLLKACENYITNTGRRITLEYILIKNINDSNKDAKELSNIAKQLKADINLISYQNVPDNQFDAPSSSTIQSFSDILKKEKASFTIRRSKGEDIKAACGQLAGKIRRDL